VSFPALVVDLVDVDRDRDVFRLLQQRRQKQVVLVVEAAAAAVQSPILK
jgi:hypothetical protein